MEKRSFKQLFFGGIYFVIFIFFASSFYFWVIKPAPSCFDKKQNQNEEGVDCGGVCAQICLPANLQSISTVDGVRVFFPATGKITLLSRIQNPNTDYGASLSYTFSVYDKENQLITTETQQTILYPNQIKYVIVPSIELSSEVRQGVKADIRFDQVNWQPAALLTQPQIVVRDQDSTRDGAFVRVKGNITNDDLVDVPEVKVIAVFFNQFRIPIGAAQTALTNVSSRETREFTIVHPVLSSLSLQRTQVFVNSD